MKLRVCKSFTFDAAHRLPNYNGPCSNLHGHQWVLEVEVSGIALATSGMVMDFVKLKKIGNDTIIADLDHHYLNEMFDNPTAELMVSHFVHKLYPIFDANSVTLERIRLYETPSSFCEWRKEHV